MLLLRNSFVLGSVLLLLACQKEGASDQSVQVDPPLAAPGELRQVSQYVGQAQSPYRDVTWDYIRTQSQESIESSAGPLYAALEVQIETELPGQQNCRDTAVGGWLDGLGLKEKGITLITVNAFSGGDRIIPEDYPLIIISRGSRNTCRIKAVGPRIISNQVLTSNERIQIDYRILFKRTNESKPFEEILNITNDISNIITRKSSVKNDIAAFASGALSDKLGSIIAGFRDYTADEQVKTAIALRPGQSITHDALRFVIGRPVAGRFGVKHDDDQEVSVLIAATYRTSQLLSCDIKVIGDFSKCSLRPGEEKNARYGTGTLWSEAVGNVAEGDEGVLLKLRDIKAKINLPRGVDRDKEIAESISDWCDDFASDYKPSSRLNYLDNRIMKKLILDNVFNYSVTPAISSKNCFKYEERRWLKSVNTNLEIKGQKETAPGFAKAKSDDIDNWLTSRRSASDLSQASTTNVRLVLAPRIAKLLADGGVREISDRESAIEVLYDIPFNGEAFCSQHPAVEIDGTQPFSPFLFWQRVQLTTGNVAVPIVVTMEDPMSDDRSNKIAEIALLPLLEGYRGKLRHPEPRESAAVFDQFRNSPFCNYGDLAKSLDNYKSMIGVEASARPSSTSDDGAPLIFVGSAVKERSPHIPD